MRKKSSTFTARTSISGSLLFVLLLILAGCGSSQGNNSNISAATSTVATTFTNATTVALTSDSTTPAPAVKLGTQPCPSAVSAPSYWDPIIGIQPNINKVESVTCSNLIGNATLQALINVRTNGTGAFLDVYVYDKITDTHPQQLLKLQGLEHGAAKVSGYNTIIIGEVDAQSSVNKNAPSNAGLVMDLFREFKWSAGAGKFEPTAFPGIFPDLTRYQAEADQQQVAQGHQPWKLSAPMTANALAVNMLKWPTNSPTTVVSGGGQNDLSAVVSVKNPNPGFGSIQVTLTRLEGNNNNIWIVTAAASNGMSITAPASRDTVTSPVTVTGTGNAFEGVIGNIVILDHTQSDIGHATAQGAVGNGSTQFSTSVTYTSSFKGGAQEGIVALYANSNAGDGIAGAVLIKVLLGV
ncbi:MAG: Gmad2 immunoglobulin-like domain-containing protein [Chloroflexota bacterium]|nr:Gmad2 immunoglobulin-like domain-containing protein [Chloroflexota bacterium]